MGDWVWKKTRPLRRGLKQINIVRRHPSYRGDESLPAVVSAEIRQLDGGFFEKFGSQLHAQVAASRASRESTSCSEEDFAVISASEGLQSEPEQEEEQPPPDHDEILSDVLGANLEQLYSEVLYELLHELGCAGCEELDVMPDKKQEKLFTFLKEAFHFDEDKHETLLSEARAKEAPDILLNVEVIEAKELRPKDCNGFSDPFCTLYLSSAPSQRYNTSVKSETLAPVWEEHFSLPVENQLEESLTVEVWDFDPAESVREKLGKFNNVKGVRGLRKLVKEIAITASTGKHDNELVGTAVVPLKSLPTGGMITWSPLEKKGKAKRQGEIHLRLALSALKNCQVACQEHRLLVRVLLRHELATTEVIPYQWCGDFSPFAAHVLSQHVAQSNLAEAHEALARWAEFCSHHGSEPPPLSFCLFGRLLEKLSRPLQNGIFNEEEVKVFWDSTKKLLPSCLTCIRKIRRLTPTDKATLVQLTALLSVLAQLEPLNPPSGTELFPSSMFGWLTVPEDGSLNCDVRQSVRDAVRQGAMDWFDHVLDNNNEENSSEERDEGEAKLSQLVRIVTLIQSDMLRTIEHHDKIFLEVLQFPYAKTVYSVFDLRVCELIQPAVAETCKKLKPLKFNDRPEDGIYDNEPVTMGTALFELYLALQRFSMLGKGLEPDEEHKVCQFHSWFHRGVAQWLDIALYKALQRIQRAVELGSLKPIDENVKFSTSAVDTLAIFYQIKIFWKELNWPDVESSYSFMAKIIDDICRCSVFYADQMSSRVSGMGDIEDPFCKKFIVTEEWCTAINNIEYVRQSLQPFAMDLGLEELVSALSEFRSPAAADHCRQTLQLVISSAIDTVGNKIADLIETLANKMCPAMQRFLQEGAELLHRESRSLEQLMNYLDMNLATLHAHLSEENFKRTLSAVWERLAQQLTALVDASLEARRPPYYYSNLSETLKVLEGFFSRGDDEQQQIIGDELLAGGEQAELLALTKARLSLHALETPQLVHAYHLARLEEQQQGADQSCGLLTVRLLFAGQTLYVEILNARNIKPTDSDGSCDPYVKIHLLPEERFAGTSKLKNPKTRVHKKNLFPLFDETFTIPVPENLQSERKSLIHFVCKDYDMLRSNELVGEAFVPFSSISHRESNDPLDQLQYMPQMHLPLTRPSASREYESLKALEHRQGDSMAKDFVKKERAKFIN